VREGWPLLGRDAELAEIQARLLGGRSVVLTGPVGAGTSRLAAVAASQIEDRGVPTHRLTATPAGSSIPFAALIGLLGTTDERDVGTAVEEHLHTTHGVVPVVVLDDLHHLDGASTAVLHDLASNGSLRLLATGADGERVPAAVDELTGDLSAARIGVPPLDDATVHELVAEVLEAPVDLDAARWVSGAACGSALLTVELGEHAAQNGVLAHQNGSWRLAVTDPPAPRLEELVGVRLGALEPDGRELVELLAIAGPIDLDLLSRAVDLDVVEELEDAGIAVVAPNGARLAVSLAHPCYGEWLRARLAAPHRQRHFSHLARAAEAVPARSVGEELRAAVWRVDSGEVGQPDRLLAAGRLAFEAGDTGLAARLAMASFHAGGGDEAARLAAGAAGQVADD
jgi:hypothetical protein